MSAIAQRFAKKWYQVFETPGQGFLLDKPLQKKTELSLWVYCACPKKILKDGYSLQRKYLKKTRISGTEFS